MMDTFEAILASGYCVEHCPIAFQRKAEKQVFTKDTVALQCGATNLLKEPKIIRHLVQGNLLLKCLMTQLHKFRPRVCPV